VRSIALGARSALVGFLIAGLMGLPARAANPQPLATVVSAQSARLANADAVPGADVYLDDDLVTNPGGSLRLAVGTSQVYLLAESEATLRQDQGKIQAKMYRGTLGFSTSTPDQIEVDTPFGMVRGVNGSRVLGQISIVLAPNTSDERITVTSYEGALLVVDLAGRSQTIDDGQTYVGTLNSDSSGGGGRDVKVVGVGAQGINWHHVIAVAIPAAILGTTAAILYIKESESCDRPDCAPKPKD